MSYPMTWHPNSPSARIFAGVEKIDQLLDSQRRYAAMLNDGDDVFYSRTDMRMLIDKFRVDARKSLLSLYCDVHGINDIASAQDLILHAAAEFKLSHRNTCLLIREYGHLINLSHPEGPYGSMPLHIAAAATGADHPFRLEAFVNAYSDAVKIPDSNDMLPLQIAAVNGADFDVIKLLIDAHPLALARPLFPRVISNELDGMIGMLPFHIACGRSYSLEVIFLILLEYPSCIIPREMPFGT